MTNKIVLYAGLNDKTTCKQEITNNDAMMIVKNLVVNSIGFGTISLAKGVYTMDTDSITITENTIRIEFTGIDTSKVKLLAIQLKQALNQESILIEEYTVNQQYI